MLPLNPLNLDRDQAYFQALLPLVVGMLVFPTLDEAQQGDLAWPRPVLIEPTDLRQRYRELALTEAGLREGRWWNLVTYMFLHRDPAHLWQNLCSIAASGLAVHRNFGTVGLYAVFFVSGGAAGLNRRGRLWQVQAQIAGSKPRLPESIGDWVPEGLQSMVQAGIDKVADGVAKSSAPILTEMSSEMGASGGACGVMGCSLGLALESLFGVVSTSLRLRNAAASAPPSGCGTDGLVATLVVLDCAVFLEREWKLFSGQDGLTGIAHAGHLTGFMVGAGLLAVVRLSQWLATEAAHRRPPTAGTGNG